MSEPSNIAFEKLRQRIEADAEMNQGIKEAALADLSGQNPEALTALKAALAGGKHESQNADRAELARDTGGLAAD
jgi:flagellar motor component MotA